MSQVTRPISLEELDALQPHPLAAMFPMIDQADYSALVNDIEACGVLEPIVLFQGKVLDGRHRMRAAIECGRGAHAIDFDGTEAQAKALVFSLNVHRRHLSTEQKRAFIQAELKADPAQSDRSIAEKVKVDNKTVAVQRARLESTEEIPQSTQRTGKDGRRTAAVKRPALPKVATKRPVKAKAEVPARTPIVTDTGLREAAAALSKVKGQIGRMRLVVIHMWTLLDAAQQSPTTAKLLRDYFAALLREVDARTGKPAAAADSKLH